MKIRTGARIPGTNQTLECELEDSDMALVADWETMPLAERWQAMSKKADTFVVEYMYRNGHISKEYAGQRLMEIKNGNPSET